MADNVGYTPGSGALIAADDIGGNLHQRIKLVLGADGVSDGDVSAANPLPVTVGNFPASQSVAVSNFPATQPVTGPLTDTQLRASPVPVTATLDTDNLEMRLDDLIRLGTSPAGFDRSLGRGRVTAVLESGTVTTVATVTTVSTVTTVTTVSALTDQTNIGGRPAQMLINQTNLSAWANCHRARIT